mgnify:FL=1
MFSNSVADDTHFLCEGRVLVTCCLVTRTSARCLPAFSALLVHTCHGLSITLASPSSVEGQATAASKAVRYKMYQNKTNVYHYFITFII